MQPEMGPRSYVAQCMQGKRSACDWALAMPNLTPHHRLEVINLQKRLPWYDLNEPTDFALALFAVPTAIYAAIRLLLFFLSRRAPARGPGPILTLIATVGPFMRNLRYRLAQLISPEPLQLAAIPVAAPHAPSYSAQMQPEVPRDPVAAQAALSLAHAYIEEVPLDTILEGGDPSGHRTTLSLAAKQLDIAQKADPTAALSIQGAGEPPTSLDQQFMRAKVLMLEGLTWAGERPRKTVALLTQATEVDPSYATAFAMLGAQLFNSRNRSGAIEALKQALALDPGNIEVRKQLDPAQNMTDAEIAAFHATRVAAGVVSAGQTTWTALKWIWMIGAPLTILLLGSHFAGGIADGFMWIATFTLMAWILPYVMRAMNGVSGALRDE